MVEECSFFISGELRTVQFGSQAIFLVYGLLIRQLSLTPLTSQS
jgi:hypothetical protein